MPRVLPQAVKDRLATEIQAATAGRAFLALALRDIDASGPGTT